MLLGGVHEGPSPGTQQVLHRQVAVCIPESATAEQSSWDQRPKSQPAQVQSLASRMLALLPWALQLAFSVFL